MESHKQTMQERDHWKSRCEMLMAELEKEKSEKYELKHQLEESVEQVSTQAEYCSSMGAAVSTLLWRAARNEGSVHDILSGSKVKEFLELAGSTLDTYMATYISAEEFPSDSCLPAQFITALTGVITNLSASPYGREYLMQNSSECGGGGSLIASCINALHKIPPKACDTLKKLLLMTLYNISINRKGFDYLCKQDTFIPLLTSFLSNPSENEVCITSLMCLQSLLQGCDTQTTHTHAIRAQLQTLVHDASLYRLTLCNYYDVSQAAKGLMNDLKQVFPDS